ncbi:helix-turn-helix domain-containing protein [Streptomyces triculaminicus]|uniref:helix-turn-helix domain-containing protein n=1 Tax=Streptomyces triculaminicus TaxID=2816232 RepID=UPI0034095B82
MRPRKSPARLANQPRVAASVGKPGLFTLPSVTQDTDQQDSGNLLVLPRIRAHVVRHAARGRSNARITRETGVHVDTVRTWRGRFTE